MAIFTNQATLTYNGNTTNSNIAYGEILDELSATKTAVTPIPTPILRTSCLQNNKNPPQRGEKTAKKNIDRTLFNVLFGRL